MRKKFTRSNSSEISLHYRFLRYSQHFFVGSHLQWAALVADKLHKVWHPIQVRSEVIYMWMGALKQFNSRYRDVDIDDTQEMKSNLSQIPEELLSIGPIDQLVLGANGWAIRIFISPRLTTNPTAASGIDVRVSLKILFLCGCLSVHTRRSS